MAPARFSAFELLLLKSRYPPDTASLLLLTWIYVNKRVALAEDQHYLEALANGYRHSDDLDTLSAIARTDLTAIQLAAEIVLRERVDEQSHPFLRRAIGLATSEGEPSLRNHHILRFLSDLSGITPGAFALLFREVTGRQLMPPGDPSRQDYWQPDERAETVTEEETATGKETAAEGNRKATDQRPLKTRRWQRWWIQTNAAQARWRRMRLERTRLRQQAKSRRQQEERQERERQAEGLRQEQARQADARRQEQQRQAEEQRREQARQEEAHRREQWRRQQWQQATGGPQTHYRVRLALQVLELDEPASSIEIKRAYRRLAQRHHPDRFHGQGDLRVSLASQRFQRIKNAYDYLMTTT
ncbi:J domain-containing protein [Salinicola halimionae]|uniref:J domain-containing protein n=1 Tax=Salinicola halimionae TaxID=1949081 RepID=UPI001CB75C4C|nr:J domain-containing protein [Salinicola halimionae]